jgi:hypothetical protein
LSEMDLSIGLAVVISFVALMGFVLLRFILSESLTMIEGAALRVRTTKKAADSPRAIGRGLLVDERGISSFEYLLLLLIILAGSIAAWHRFGASLDGKIGESAKRIDRLDPGAAVDPGQAGPAIGVPSRGALSSSTDAISVVTGNQQGPSASATTDPALPTAVAANNHRETMSQAVAGNGTWDKTATPGKIISGEPITNPQVKAALLEAFEASHPVYQKHGTFANRSEEQWPREHGLTGTKPGFFDRLLGNDFSLERWDEGPKCDIVKGCNVEIPENVRDGSLKDDLLFTAHIHPMEDPRKRIMAKDYDMYMKYASSAPHYIVAPEGVYRFTMGTNGMVKTEFLGPRQNVLY